MLMRYGILTGAAAIALFGAVRLGNTQSDVMLVDAGGGMAHADLSLWVLGMIAALMALSLGRLVIFGLPSMMGGWFGGNKTWLLAIFGGSLISAALYLV